MEKNNKPYLTKAQVIQLLEIYKNAKEKITELSNNLEKFEFLRNNHLDCGICNFLFSNYNDEITPSEESFYSNNNYALRIYSHTCKFFNFKIDVHKCNSWSLFT